jgi:hypothetical protein
VASPFVEPCADRRGLPKRHATDGHIGPRESAGGPLSLDGAPTHPEGVCQLIEAVRQRLDAGPVGLAAFESLAQFGQDRG